MCVQYLIVERISTSKKKKPYQKIIKTHLSLVCVFSVTFPPSFLAPSMSTAEANSISLLIFTEISKEIADDFSRF